jgi:predicted ribonuclease YlaK
MAKSGAKRKRTQKFKAELNLVKDSKHDTDWKLNWYCPQGRQNDIIDAMDNHDLTIVNAPSGCGKSSTVIYKALQDYRKGTYRKVVLIKNATESADECIGFLVGGKDQKLEAHMASMKKLFQQFMSNNKLENDISNGNIVLDIPNYLLGSTIDNALILIEEAQTMSPQILKLCMERAGQNSKVVVVGDSRQRYSAKKRSDGLADLIQRTTYDNYGAKFSNNEMVGYVEMDSSHNMRSDLSKYITELYVD